MDMVGLQVGHCVVVPLPLVVAAVWWSGLSVGSVKSTSSHWWLELETATEHRDSDVWVSRNHQLYEGSAAADEMSLVVQVYI